MLIIRSFMLISLLSMLSIGCNTQFPDIVNSSQIPATKEIPDSIETTVTPKLSIATNTPIQVTDYPTIPVKTTTPTSDIDNDSTTVTVNRVTPTSTKYDSETWMNLPVIPEMSPKVKEIYERGLNLGNNPHAFSKIGDCGSTPAWFLGDFDRGPQYYELGEYQELLGVIEHFQGSYARTSLAAKSGFNASSIFAPIWSNREYCRSNETPLDCEYRVNQPIFAFITLGTNDVWHQDTFEPQMRKIIELSIENGVVPILSTKADDLEGDGSINSTIARLAVEYQVPLWNYWVALQDLPDHGLQEDGSHLTWGPNRFDDPQVLQRAWPIRNLTALQVLNTVWQYVNLP